MAMSSYPSNSISRHTLARFLEKSVNRHSCFPMSPGTHNFYYQLITTTAAPTNTLVLSMMYMTKLRALNAPLLCERPGNLIFTSCLLLAFDFLDDTPYDTTAWSFLSNYSTKDINSVVRSIMRVFDYHLTVTPSAFHKYKTFMLKYILPPNSSIDSLTPSHYLHFPRLTPPYVKRLPNSGLSTNLLPLKKYITNP
ncbi:hypothetical protein DSO57_1039058 [Entomophthora muscae]|uniref:Uncharacterized protein n=1 Tax=Entomophthora muscae TaxID=34485 RepID=A0ACC2UJD8_9FUNG|nr:hypothetical protein DSO57_1039058 [Entomophthora muscae]